MNEEELARDLKPLTAKKAFEFLSLTIDDLFAESKAEYLAAEVGSNDFVMAAGAIGVLNALQRRVVSLRAIDFEPDQADITEGERRALIRYELTTGIKLPKTPIQ